MVSYGKSYWRSRNLDVLQKKDPAFSEFFISDEAEPPTTAAPIAESAESFDAGEASAGGGPLSCNSIEIGLSDSLCQAEPPTTAAPIAATSAESFDAGEASAGGVLSDSLCRQFVDLAVPIP